MIVNDDDSPDSLPVSDNAHIVDRSSGGYEYVLETWFDLPHKDERDDDKVLEYLAPFYEPARRGELDSWKSDPRGRLALIILLDQVPRHIFRGRPTQYQTDSKAQRLAEPFVEKKLPDSFTYFERYYAALPYLHAEDPDKQRKVNPVIHECARHVDGLEGMGSKADEYLELIERFGRFPHRNDLLGRDSTAEERDFLD